MLSKNWKNPHDYLFAGSLSKEQWAWEFLRRNPDYQKEWAHFHAVWQALEADYGKPGNRDFCAWKADARAWVPADECLGSDCRVDQDKVLIECAMGARWGFHKFPPDPADDDPIGGGRLNWRSQEPDNIQLVTSELAYPGGESSRIALGFDLTLPLKDQLERAKRFLQMIQRQRLRDGKIQMNTIAANADHWRLLLRLLDGLHAGAGAAELGLLPGNDDLAANRALASDMVSRGYRRILLLPD